MIRTAYSRLPPLVKKCLSRQRTMMAVFTRTLTAEPTVAFPTVEKPPQVKALIEVADSCGVCPRDMDALIESKPHLLQYTPNHWSYVLKILLEFGFKEDKVLHMLSECPDILKMKSGMLLDNLETWCSASFGNDLMFPLLRHNPVLLTAEKSYIIKRIQMLLPYLEGRKRIAKAITIAPSIFFENWDTLFKKFEYLHSLRTDASDIATTGVLRYDLHYIKMRHEFLYRAGLYKMPTKDYRKSLDKNKKLDSILNTSNRVFAVKVAGLTLPEYEAFQEMYSLEIKDDEDSYSDAESDSE